MFAQPLIAVENVRASREWYEKLLKCKSQYAGMEDHPHTASYDRLVYDDRVILQLHSWDEEDHPNLTNRAAGPVGHGVLLWFQVEDDAFDAVVQRAKKMGVDVIEEPHRNFTHMEFWIRDPDGYVIVIAGPDDEDEMGNDG